MEIIPTSLRAAIKRAARVEGAEIVSKADSDSVLPDHIQVSWHYELGDSEWRLTWMDIAGFRIKKDGTPGERRATILFSEHDIDEAPEWARKFMTESAPELPPYK